MSSTKTAILNRGKDNLPVEINGRSCGLSICEDIWNDEDFWPRRRYRSNPIAGLVGAGAEIILNISASPWHVGKEKLRHDMLASLARKSRRPVLLCNMAGGNDELIFDGDSMAFNAAGELIARARAFEEDFVVVDTANSPAITPAGGGGRGKHLQGPGAGTAGLHAEMRVQIRRDRVERRD